MSDYCRHRQKLRSAITSLDADASDKIVRSVLNPIFEDFTADHDDTSTKTDLSQSTVEASVTPLMVACDKSHSAALRYLIDQMVQNESQQSEGRCNDAPFSKQSAQQHDEETSKIPLHRLVEVWGHPTESSATPEGGNCAAHHALAAGYQFGIKVLEYFMTCIAKSDDSGNKYSATELQCERLSRQVRYLSLLSQTNANGDTPIMMACVFGRVDVIQYILTHFVQLSTEKKAADESLSTSFSLLRKVFAMKNSEGCSALNLSCGHGNVDTVKLMVEPLRIRRSGDIQRERTKTQTTQNNIMDKSTESQVLTFNPLLEVSYDDVKMCTAALEDLDAGLKIMKRQSVEENKRSEFNKQYNRIKKCLETLECELERISAEAAADLTLDDASIVHTGKQPKSCRGRSKKKKRRPTKQTSKQASPLPGPTDDESVEIDAATPNDWHIEKEVPMQVSNDNTPMNASPFVTLQDGSVVSKHQHSSHMMLSIADDLPFEENGQPIETVSIFSPTPSLKSILLQSQHRQQEHNKQSMSSDTASRSDNSKFISIEAKMESLCLDPSMLLLTSHGMAMEMSPCQLEAIESILKHQLNATLEAKRIQSRLLDDQKETK